MSQSGSYDPLQHPQKKEENPRPVALDFDLDASRAAIDRRLADVLQSQNSGRIFQAVEEEPEEPARSLAAPAVPAPHAAALQEADDVGGSDFLAELMRESDQLAGSKSQEIEVRQARALRLHESLARIFKFLNVLATHVNKMEPGIARIYSLDARTVYKDLVCRNASADIRKQDISDSALNDYVSFGLNLRTPHPVVCMRTWLHLEELRRELHNLRIEVLNDEDIDGKKAKQEWVQVRLAQHIPVLIKFQGNYGNLYIDVSCRNLGTFGITNFRLEPDAVTQGMLDDLGRYIIGRADKLPAAFMSV